MSCPITAFIFDFHKLFHSPAGLLVARAGNRCKDIANTFFAVLKKYAIEKKTRTSDETVRENNMTFHFMTGIWAENFGLEITKSIVIGESGPECIANVARKLVIKD